MIDVNIESSSPLHAMPLSAPINLYNAVYLEDLPAADNIALFK